MTLAALHALVVDDHPLMTQILGAMLRAVGIQKMRFARSFDEAVGYLDTAHFDLLITDFEMPGASGVDLTRWVRTSPKSRWVQMPVILVTAYSDRLRIEQARDAGVTEIVTKPISAQMLVSRIAHAIDRPRGFVMAPHYTGPDRRRRADPKFAGPDRRRKDMHDVILE